MDVSNRSKDSDRRKRKYRSDGTPTWMKGNIDGPGIWVSCVKGKEKQTVGEVCDLFESLAGELWPGGVGHEKEGHDEDKDAEHCDEDDMDGGVEAQIARELASMKQPRKQQRFNNCQTNTPCVIFISCKPPVDPVELVLRHVENVHRTGVTHTRYTHRLVPVSGTCVTNVPEIHSLCERVMTPFFSARPDIKFKYKIDLRMRNHTTLTRPTIIQEVARCVPDGHVVNLENPEIFILVEIFKGVCGVSIVRDYYRFSKFNVMEIANTKNMGERFSVGEGPFPDGEMHGGGAVDMVDTN